MTDDGIVSPRRLTAQQIAICALLEQPDPDDLHRGHVHRLDGKPDRHARYLLLPVIAVNLSRQDRGNT